MVVHFKLSALKQGRPYEYFVRFALGGLATVVAGVVTDWAGPESGGLMLAHLGEETAAKKIENAIFSALQDKDNWPADIGGNASTTKVTDAIISILQS